MDNRDVSYELGGQLFVWDIKKHESNVRKHEITFEEAATAIMDIRTFIIDDKEHSLWEERFNVIGMSEKNRILFICYCMRENNAVVRIFSARKATNNELQEWKETLYAE